MGVGGEAREVCGKTFKSFACLQNDDARLTKPITSMAVMCLVQEKILDLTEKLLDLLTLHHQLTILDKEPLVWRFYGCGRTANSKSGRLTLR